MILHHYLSYLFLLFQGNEALVQWTAVPPSPNPRAKLNQKFLEDLTSIASIERVEDGRIWFQTEDVDQKLCQLNARSIRLVAMESQNLDTEDPMSIIPTLCNNWDTLLFSIQTWREAGNKLLDSTATFTVSCQKWKSFQFSNASTTMLCNELSKHLAREFEWTRVTKKEDPTLKLNLLLHGSTVTLELITFVVPLATDELPKPGFKRVESFIMAKAANIQPREVVLDPMCGRATFLVEAATLWPQAEYQGVDLSITQLEDGAENCKAANVSVELVCADSRKLEHFKDGSVDKILCCPPFGRQFSIESDKLYDELLQEWSRVLKPTGRMVLLVDTPNVDSLAHAVKMASCRVEFIRSPPFRLGKIRGTIVIVVKDHIASYGSYGSEPSPGEGLFDWERGDGRGRALWTALRAQALPALVAYSKARPVKNLYGKRCSLSLSPYYTPDANLPKSEQ